MNRDWGFQPQSEQICLQAMSQPLPFKPFDEQGVVRIYYNGFLPHWRQIGCTYFVTFRLEDSVPKKVVEQWRYERDKWLNARGITAITRENCSKALTKLSEHDRKLFERHFAGKLFEYLDRGYGACHLRRDGIRKIVNEALRHFHGQRMTLGDYVVMPNHVHALLTPGHGFELENILHSIKSFTSNRINERLARSGEFWMRESYDHVVRDAEELIRIQDYIRRNPEKAKLSSTEFSYQSAVYELSR